MSSISHGQTYTPKLPSSQSNPKKKKKKNYQAYNIKELFQNTEQNNILNFLKENQNIKL